MPGKTDGYIFHERNVTGDRSSAVIDARSVDDISVIYKWTGDLAGAFEVWTTNDENPGSADEPIGWWETAATFTTNPGGTPGTAEQKLLTPNKYYQIRWDHTAATTANQLFMSLSVKKQPKVY